ATFGCGLGRATPPSRPTVPPGRPILARLRARRAAITTRAGADGTASPETEEPMKTSFNILLAAVLSAAFAAGQDPEAGTAEAPRSGPIKATLEPVQEVVTVPSADAPAEGSGSEARF